MPESKSRKKPVAAAAPQVKKVETGNPPWLIPVMLGLMILGLAWIVLFYLTSNGARLPIPALGQWNLAVGFVFIIAGFGLTTRWK